MGVTINADQRTTAYPQLLVAQQAMGHAGMLLMLGITALTAVNTFNGGFVTLSRFVYAVAREGKLPRAFTRLNDRAVPVSRSTSSAAPPSSSPWSSPSRGPGSWSSPCAQHSR